MKTVLQTAIMMFWTVCRWIRSLLEGSEKHIISFDIISALRDGFSMFTIFGKITIETVPIRRWGNKISFA
jgi:hypothetical protein